MNSPCSVVLLESALAGNLSADDEAVLHRHLEECEQCSAALERMAGGPAWCEEAAALLVKDALDEALPAREEWSDADFTVEHLEPADEPGVLGRLGGYDVLEIIGRGGMGVVLKGFDRELKRCVAIKVLAPHFALSSLARKRFTREAQAAASVVHPNVLAIHQVHPNERLPFLVMPLVAGESLAQRLTAQGRLELKETLRIGMQAAAGLAAAHEQGLVHRDVKPANILLEKGVERAVLTDFGLARAADDVTLTRWGVIAGTPQYMSPEQARGETLDGRSDLFSLGCVLYEMATGVSPFRTESVMATIRRLVDDAPQAISSLNPELPPWFVAIVDRLLEKDPARRFSSAKEVSELLEGCLAHVQQPGSVPLPAALPKPVVRTRWSRIYNRKGVIAMIAALGIGLFGAFMLLSEPQDISGQWTGANWGQVDLKKTGEREFEGTYTETDVKDGKQPGEIRLKWSRIERQYVGTWREGNRRFGEISVCRVGDDIHGALTTDPKSQVNIPRLHDLTWVHGKAAVAEERAATPGAPPRNVSPAVAVAVSLVSRLTAKDPDLDVSVESLKGLNETEVVKELSSFLDSKEANVRRAALYVLWKGKFVTIEPVVPKLLRLSRHDEEFTRGMAALALGGNRIGSSLGILEKMTSDDPSGYARRCGAFALGDLGNPAAIPALKKALDDPEGLVRNNAQAALKKLGVKDDSGAVSPQRVHRWNLDTDVATVACSPDGTLIAVGNTGPTMIGGKVADNWQPMVKILDAKTGSVIAALTLALTGEEAAMMKTIMGFSIEVKSLVFSPDSKMLAVGTSIGQVKLFDARSGNLLRSLDDAQGRENDASSANTILGSIPRALGSVEALAFSPNGQMLAVGGDSFADRPLIKEKSERHLRRSMAAGRLELWDVSGKLRHDLVGHSHVFAVAFSPDGKRLASAGTWSGEHDYGAGARIWDPASGEMKIVISTQANGGAHSVAFSPDGKLVAIGYQRFDKNREDGQQSDGMVVLARAASGVTEWLQTLPGWAKPVAFTPDGKSVVVLRAGRAVQFLDEGTGQQKTEIRSGNPGAGQRWNDMCLMPQGKLLVIGGTDMDKRGLVEVWDLHGTAGAVRSAIDFLHKSIHEPKTGSTEKPASVTRSFPLRFKLASDMADDLRQILSGRPDQEAKPSANNREVSVTAPPDMIARVQTFITVMDWPDNITRQPNFEYPRRTVMHAARSFFYACAIEDTEEVFSKLLSLQVLAELKGDTKSKDYTDYSMGESPDPEWEKSLRGDWPGKKEAIQRLVREWNRYPLSRITENSGVAIGFGVKHFCSVSFDGAPKDFYTITIEPSRTGRGPAKESYFFSTLPPSWKPAEKKP